MKGAWFFDQLEIAAKSSNYTVWWKNLYMVTTSTNSTKFFLDYIDNKKKEILDNVIWGKTIPRNK